MRLLPPLKPRFNKEVFTASALGGVFFLWCPTDEPVASIMMAFLSFAAGISEIIHYKKEVKKYKIEVENGHKKD